MWDERAGRTEEIETGTAVEIVDGYVRERDGSLELHVGDRGAIEEIEDEVSFTPETTAIDTLEIDQVADIGGVVRSADPKRTFDRDDGSEGQVRNVRVQDDTGDIRVALWGDKADIDVQAGDEVFFAEVEVQDGWQDALEASANWRSTVVVLDDSATGAADESGGETATADGAGQGLAAFADGEAPETEEASDATEATGADDATDDDAVEFTGTVVQTGDPVILDDGEETMAVQTDATVNLGQEVTARGSLSGGTLDADDVF